MHLLFATSIVPDGALASGYEIANAAIIDALRRAGARVTVIGFTWPGKAAIDPQNTVVLGSVNVSTEGASWRKKLRWVVKAIASGRTFASVKLRILPDEEIRAAMRKAGPFDGYVMNSVQFAGAFERLFEDLPSIFVAHNVEYRSAEENAAAARSLPERLLYRREARLLKALEERICRKACFVLTLAQEDREPLGVGSDDRSAVLPLVTRPSPPARIRRRIECDAALIGTWTWRPNRIGLDWFLDSVVPHLRPDFRIRIAGGVPAGVTSSHPGVTFVGRVEDAQDFVCSAAVIPLISTAGSGVQLKTIETFELGLPSVATTRSLRGIDYRPENCVVTDDPAAFARALEKAASAKPADGDGSAFHRSQIARLDAAVAHGLGTIGAVRQAVPA